jgi:hypothetical protein
VLDGVVESVVCRWCSASGAAIEEVPLPGDGDGDPTGTGAGPGELSPPAPG